MMPFTQFMAKEYTESVSPSEDEKAVLAKFAAWVGDYLRNQRPIAMTAYRSIPAIVIDGETIPLYSPAGTESISVVTPGPPGTPAAPPETALDIPNNNIFD